MELEIKSSNSSEFFWIDDMAVINKGNASCSLPFVLMFDPFKKPIERFSSVHNVRTRSTSRPYYVFCYCWWLDKSTKFPLHVARYLSQICPFPRLDLRWNKAEQNLERIWLWMSKFLEHFEQSTSSRVSARPTTLVCLPWIRLHT